MSNNIEMPLGLSMMLAQNSDAMMYFASLDDAGKQNIINKTHEFSSKKEMRNLVDSLGRRERDFF